MTDCLTIDIVGVCRVEARELEDCDRAVDASDVLGSVDPAAQARARMVAYLHTGAQLVAARSILARRELERCGPRHYLGHLRERWRAYLHQRGIDTHRAWRASSVVLRLAGLTGGDVMLDRPIRITLPPEVVTIEDAEVMAGLRRVRRAESRRSRNPDGAQAQSFFRDVAAGLDREPDAAETDDGAGSDLDDRICDADMTPIEDLASGALRAASRDALTLAEDAECYRLSIDACREAIAAAAVMARLAARSGDAARSSRANIMGGAA